MDKTYIVRLQMLPRWLPGMCFQNLTRLWFPIIIDGTQQDVLPYELRRENLQKYMV